VIEGPTRKTHSDILPTPPVNFTGVKKCKILPRFSTPAVPKPKQFAHPSPNFLHRGQTVQTLVQIWNLGWSSSEKQCSWNRKQTTGTPTTVICPHKIWFRLGSLFPSIRNWGLFCLPPEFYAGKMCSTAAYFCLPPKI